MKATTTIKIIGDLTFDLTESQVAWFVNYGLKQKIDDAGAIAKDEYPEADERLKESLKRKWTMVKLIKKGDVPSSGGGRSITDFENHFRAVVIPMLVRDHGMKKTAATKVARSQKFYDGNKNTAWIVTEIERRMESKSNVNVELTLPADDDDDDSK